MGTLRIAVCEDKERNAGSIGRAAKRAFEGRGFETSIEIFASSEGLWKALQNGKYDLLLLDIGLPQTDGITLAERIRVSGNNIDIIYVSGREDQVYDTFKVQPVAFVRKSNFLSDLNKAVDIYCRKKSVKNDETVILQNKSGIMNIPLQSIVYFEGSGKTQIMHLKDSGDAVTVYRSMTELEERFRERGFIRIHKGFLVNSSCIYCISADCVELTSGEKLPLSQRRAADVKREYLEILRRAGSVLF